MGTASDYTVTITATDADNDPSELTYEGSVTGLCTDIDAEVSTVNCPNAAPYTGTVIVEDPDGNVSDAAEFTFNICESSSCGESPTSCEL
jgi:hypothetical protein